MSDSETIEFRVLGPLELRAGDRALPLGSPKQRALLALLVVHANEPVSRDRLIDELWGDAAPATVNSAFHVYLSRLRKLLGELLVRGADGYTLRVDPDRLDARRFERLAGEGREALAVGDAPRAAERLREALALWRGPPLSGLSEPFAVAAAGRLEEERLAALEDRIEADLELGRHGLLVAEIENLVAEHPYRERLRAQLMLALYRSGRQAEALEAFIAARSRFVEELAIEPGPELKEMQRRILAQDPELGPAPRPARLVSRKIPVALLVLAAALVVSGLAAAIVEFTGRSGGTVVLTPNAVGEIDAENGRVLAQVPLPGRPARLATDGRSLWVGGDASGTISDIDPRTHARTKLVAGGGFPSDIALGFGSAWVVDGRSGTLAKIDPSYGKVVKRKKVADVNPAYDESREALDPVSIAAGLGSIWLTEGATKTLLRVDPVTLKVTKIDLGTFLDGVAIGAGRVWVIGGYAATVIALDRHGRVTARIPIASSSRLASPIPIAVAEGAGFVWVLNGNTATVTKIDPVQDAVSATIRIGLEHNPLHLSVGPRAAWIASGDGTLARIDPTTNTVTMIPVGHRLRDVAVAAGRVWVTTGTGLSSNATTSTVTGPPQIRALPPTSCAPIYYQGSAPPRFLIASDLPLLGSGPSIIQMAQAIQLTLRQHHFRAGPYTVAYQSCDASGLSLIASAQCAANARAYAADQRVIGIVGSAASGCSKVEIPILNRAPQGPLAMISPASTEVGLTHAGAGTAPGEPDRYYPTRTRNFVRVIAADDVQGAADALFARQLGDHRLYVLNDSESYGRGLAADFMAVARKLGLEIVGSTTWSSKMSDFRPLVSKVRRSGATAVFLAGLIQSNGPALIRELRAGLGPGVKIIASDGFADWRRLIDDAGRASENMIVSVAGLPNQRLPAEGKKFITTLTKADGETPYVFSAYAAQAAQVLLDTIARSNGTRASVTAQLLHTKVTNGLLGNFTFDKNGDTSADTITLYKITHAKPAILKVITPPPALVHNHTP